MRVKIQRPTATSIGEAYQAGAVRPSVLPDTGAAAPVSKGDSLSVSQRAQQAATLRAKLAEAPSIRVDLVQRIKEQVEAGTYAVSSEKVAASLLRSKVLDT